MSKNRKQRPTVSPDATVQEKLSSVGEEGSSETASNLFLEQKWSASQWRWATFGGMLLLTLLMFGREIFSSKDLILSGDNTDITHQFIFWREFGFNELKHGNLALWNPHNFCGAPYFGGFQSALLYPPNWLYMVLPLAKAIDVGIALHVFLAGVFMYLWAEKRKLHPAACALCGVLWMFCGAHFFHIYAGHLPNLCALIWPPLLFLAIDGLFERANPSSVLLGGFAVAMEVLAGHPQYVFYTAVAAAIYSLLCLWQSKQRGAFAMSLAGLCVIGGGLSAVQILTGVAATAELNRSTGISFHLASIFSFPPENFLTLLMPGFFGGTNGTIYWGRCYLWEMCIFISITGFLLALYGAIRGERSTRRFAVTMIVALFLLALGSRTPLFHFLFSYVPGFDKFRGMSKFIFLASIFLILLAGIGLDALLKHPAAARKLLWTPMVLGGMLLIAVAINAATNSDLATGSWQRLVAKVPELHESWNIAPQNYHNPQFIKDSFHQANRSLWLAAITCFVLAGVLFLSRRSSKWIMALPFLATVEVLVFATQTLAHFELSSVYPIYQKQLHDDHPGDFRIADTSKPNAALSFGNFDIWGYDPGVLLRFAQFMAWTQGLSPDRSTESFPVTKPSPLFAMLRGKYWLQQKGDEIRGQPMPGEPLSRLQLVNEYIIKTGRDEIFAALTNAAFDPHKSVILEKEPSPKPVASDAPGEVKIVESSTDHLVLEAKLAIPSILLITDSYSKDWKVTALPGSGGSSYELLPANYCLQAIPLGAGEHKLRIEYLPMAFVVGKWISSVSVVACLGLFAWCLKSRPCRLLKEGRSASSRLSHEGCAN